MAMFDPNYDSSEERKQSVYDVDPLTCSLEYLAETTDEFASHLVYYLLGKQAYEKAYEEGEIRFIAVKMCTTFIQFMKARADRQTEYLSAIDRLNDLI